MPRLFVSLPIPAEVAAALARAVPEHPALRRVAPELMHITLAFIGHVDEERVPAASDAVTVAALGHGPFEARILGIGRFPERGRPRMVWAGMTPQTTDAVVRLGASVRAELLRHDVPFDPKPLRAHVTLARVRDPPSDDDARALVAALGRARPERELRFPARTVHLMESTLGPGGARYASRAALPLTGAASPGG